MAKSVKPSGLSIARSGGLFTFTWKIGDKDYGNGQRMRYRYMIGGQWTGYAEMDIGKTATSFSVDLSGVLSSLQHVEFGVNGNRKKYKKNGKTINPGWSGYESTTWSSTIPEIRTCEYENVGSNEGKIKWDVQNDSDGTAVLTNVQIYTGISDTEYYPPVWTLLSSSASGEETITEDTARIAQGNILRWFWVHVNAPAGSVDRYDSHAYGAPADAVVTKASAETHGAFSRISVFWDDYPSKRKPIDSVTVQYVIAVPAESELNAPADGWSEGAKFQSTATTDRAVVNVDDVIGKDDCMWIRIMLEHDGLPSYSNAMLSQKGRLQAPTINAVPDGITGDVAITITEETGCDAANTAIFYRTGDDPGSDRIIGILPRRTTTTTINVPEIIGVTETCFGAFAFVGSYNAESLIVNPVMTSEKVTDRDIVAMPPRNVVVTEGPMEGSVRIGWEWSWNGATSAELSWADNPYAWESTEEPSSYEVTNRYANSWIISGLDTETGTYYFRVRLIMDDETNDEIIGPWSDVVSYSVSGSLDKPALNLSRSTINEGGTVTARWAFATTEGQEQIYAEIVEVTFDENNDPVYGDVIASADVNQSVEVTKDWQTGKTYYLAVRITTTSGIQTAWSDPVSLYVTEPVGISVVPEDLTNGNMAIYCNFTDVTLYDDHVDMMEGQRYERYRAGITEATRDNPVIYTTVDEETGAQTTTSVYPYYRGKALQRTLREMPLSVKVHGAGVTGTTVLSIVRSENYHLYRPDGKDFDGYSGETIVTHSQIGEDQITITVDDLIGRLDDGAKYIMIATVIDNYGQIASEKIPFIVNWTHKAKVPGVSITVDRFQRIAMITPIAPMGALETDTCDIYRLSADKPELICKGALFGTTYVDPFPAFGEAGGHRLVTMTANGDYATQTGIGWYDAGFSDGDVLDEEQIIIDVNGDQIELPYDISLSNKWNKDFKRTSYLGGAVHGDWNPAVTRDLSADTVLVRGYDLDRQLMMRDLAGYAGVAHVRTPDGSSITADVQINEKQSYDTKRVSYTMTIQAIDPQEPDGMTLEQWNEMYPIGE